MYLNIIIWIIFLTLFIIFIIYFIIKKNSIDNSTILIVSPFDNNEYLIQNLDNKEKAIHILSVVRRNIFLMRDYLMKNMDKYPKYKKYIQQFCNRIKNISLVENAPNGEYTSYTINKGEEIALCLRSVKTNELHDINLIMYVVIHELAHVACPEKHHTELFRRIFIFFLEIAIKLKIYNNTNYKFNPHEYCGLSINENLLDT